MSEKPVDFNADSSDLGRALESASEMIGRWARTSYDTFGEALCEALSAELHLPLSRERCALSMPEGGEEFHKHFNWAEAEAVYAQISRGDCYEWSDGDLHSEPEPLALLPYCDSCYSPLMARRDVAMLTTVLVCETCGDRQRIEDRAMVGLSETDQDRLVELLKRSQG